MRLEFVLIVACNFVLSAHKIGSVHIAKKDNSFGRVTPLYAELDVTETSFLLSKVFSRISACGHRLVWIDRKDFSAKKEETKAQKGPIILVATGGPSEEEKEYFRNTPRGQRIILLHPSDEFLTQTDVSMYGSGVSQVFRNYYHAEMGDESLQYLLESSKGPVPKVLWLPLGLANLKPLPAAFRFEFVARPYLWAWAGDTLGKPERTDMLQALEQHASSAQIMQGGVLQSFSGYAGKPSGGSQGTANTWEYSMMMRRTQFVPVPAGMSPEQFRIWEAFEAGCIPIVLEKHVAEGKILYPLAFLGFEYVQLQSWQELPDKLLQLAEEIDKDGQVYAKKQQHNSKLWARVKAAVATKVAISVCEAALQKEDSQPDREFQWSRATR